MCAQHGGKIMNIEHLINNIGNAVSNSHKIGELNSMAGFLKDYFDIVKDEKGETYVPKNIRIELPCGNDEHKIIVAPMAALVHHNSMNIEYVKLNLNINVKNENTESIDITSQNTEGVSGTGTGELEIMFRCSETPEGVARVETQLNNIL